MRVIQRLEKDHDQEKDETVNTRNGVRDFEGPPEGIG